MDPLGTGVGVLKTGGAFDLTFQTNSAEKMRIQNSNGNVGIGTTAPLGPLHVSSANSANNLFLQTSHATSNANGIIFKARGANKWVISNDWSENGTQDFTIFDSVASSTRFFINSAGNIGIGTTTPAGALTVMNGNVGIGTWSLTGNSGALIVASGAGNVGIGTIRPGTALDVNGTVRSISGGFTFPDGTTQTSAASGGGWTDGGTNVYTSTTTDNVGIGTTTPASTLTLLGNIGIGTTLPYRTIAGPNNGMITEGNVGIGTWSAVNGKLIVMGGNVGIGTTKPTHALDVYGDGVVGIGGAITITHGAYTLINTSDSQLSLAINGTNLINLWSSNSVSILPNSTSTGLDVTQSGTGSAATFMGGNVGIGTTEPVGALTVMNGNVGIGTWSPISALEVKAPGSAQITINGASGGCLMFRDTDNAGWTECNALNGVLTCSLDADGVCDGS
jgi:hypothetical protein